MNADPRKVFSRLLCNWMNSEDMHQLDLAWVLDCQAQTVTRWVAERGLPGRDNAVKLSCLSHDLEAFFNKLAGADAAQKRLGKRKARAA